METAINTPINFAITNSPKINIWNETLAIADSQSEHKTIWFLFSLVFQGVLFLPIPAVLMYYYHASIIVLPITFGLYLANIIVGMGGSGIRVMLGFILVTVMVNLGMLAFYIL
jgi:hypothetical protein